MTHWHNTIEALYRIKDKKPLLIDKVKEGHYLVFFEHKEWELWPEDKCWREIASEIEDENHFEMFYGNVYTFIKKNILKDKSIPENHGKIWTDDEIKIALNMASEGGSAIQIAEYLKRKPTGVIVKVAEQLEQEIIKPVHIRSYWEHDVLSLLSTTDSTDDECEI